MVKDSFEPILASTLILSLILLISTYRKVMHEVRNGCLVVTTIIRHCICIRSLNKVLVYSISNQTIGLW